MNKLFAFEIEYQDPGILFNSFADTPYAMLFDGRTENHPNSHYSYILYKPHNILIKNDKSIFSELKNYFKNDIEMNPDLPPFQGGMAGYFGYELGFDLEESIKRESKNSHYPKAVFGVYDKLISFDHTQKKAWVIVRTNKKQEAEKFKEQVLKAVKPQRRTIETNLKWDSNFLKAEYKETIQKTINYICEGDIFQANISQRFEAKLPSNFDPYAQYLKLRETAPAPYSAYLNLDSFVIASCSPESFISVKKDKVRTQPIKGTSSSNTQATELEKSKKDKAENIMIVDLLRNDLAKTCLPDSIEVPKLCALESFSHVHHLVSTVTGTTAQDITSLDVLEKSFPGGSITGAPKIRAMEIIDELEPVERGPYCGAIGLIGYDGFMETSITIRTLIFDKDIVHFNVGGGITAKSDPEQEYLETLDKAAGIFESFEKNKQEAAE